jgi:PBP4 family serine-type D-alanyl-D-alanine carboxypeptidase
VIDDSYFEGKRVADGWTTDDESWFYASQTGALSVNENILTAIVRPGEQVGDLAIVTTNPAGYVRIDNHAITGRRGAKDTLSFYRIRGENEVVVAGSIPLKHGRVVKFMTIDDPGLYMGYVLRNVLESAGIRVQGYVRRKERKKGVQRSRLLVRNRSVPLSAIVRCLNKVSDNFYAEQLVKTIGAVKEGNGSWEGGLKVVQSFLKKFRIRGPYRIADGSGLSRYNLVTPQMITAVLRAMRREKHFVGSLPVAGKDRGYGTLRRRMKRTLAAGNLRAKTGTLEDVSALSGYLNSLDGEPLVFSIMSNQAVGNLALEKRLQDRIGVVLASNRAKDSRDALQKICDAL